jgi:cytidylate kinase
MRIQSEGAKMSLITITSGIGSGDLSIARSVSEKLQLELYDDQRLQEEAVKLGISAEEIKNYGKKTPGLLNRLLSYKPDTYLNVMGSVIYEVASRGEGIILGHGAPWLLMDFGCALHVRLYASESSRTRNLMDQLDVSRESAEKMIRKSDQQHKGFLQFTFRMDWDDPSLFDVIINQDKVGADSSAQLIVEMAQSSMIKQCSLTALDSMERLSLLKRVEAAMAKNRISSLDVNIEVPEPGVVYLSGSLNPLESEANLLEVVKGVPGVKKVRSEVVVPEIPDMG